MMRDHNIPHLFGMVPARVWDIFVSSFVVHLFHVSWMISKILSSNATIGSSILKIPCYHYGDIRIEHNICDIYYSVHETFDVDFRFCIRSRFMITMLSWRQMEM